MPRYAACSALKIALLLTLLIVSPALTINDAIFIIDRLAIHNSGIVITETSILNNFTAYVLHYSADQMKAACDCNLDFFLCKTKQFYYYYYYYYISSLE